jgi:hypothetical protein
MRPLTGIAIRFGFGAVQHTHSACTVNEEASNPVDSAEVSPLAKDAVRDVKVV